MRSTVFVVALVIWAGLGLAQTGTAQTAARPTIHHVTLHESAGVLTITGTGFGREPAVTVDGQPVTVLQGGTETQIDVLAPAALLTTPGTYRLTVVDPVRQVGDAFGVASRPGGVGSSGAAASATPPPVTGTAPAVVGPSVAGAVVAGAPAVNGPAPQTVIEDPVAPYRTALGYEALLNNTSTGFDNTASGYQALRSSTFGDDNTASGFRALRSNTTGSYNTASGSSALAANTSGNSNTASGLSALASNTTASANTASGFQALLNNTTGQLNVALGANAGFNATTGSYNLFLGAQVNGTAADTNTIRIGLPYNAINQIGQNKTFIAGIYGTQLTPSGAFPVFIDANGQLGTLGATGGTGAWIPTATPRPGVDATVVTLQQQVRDQQTIIADLRARLARVEALLTRLTGR